MKKVKDIMTTDVVTIEGGATIAEAIKVLQKKNLRALLVEPRSDDDAYGIITETDIVYKIIAYDVDPTQIKVHEIMTKPCIVVNPDLGVKYLARLFSNTGIRRAPVIKDKLQGIVTVTDILRKGLEKIESFPGCDTIRHATKSAKISKS